MIGYIFFIVLFLSSSIAYAQHLPSYSQYMLNPLILNSAQAGSAQGLRAVMHYRKQWIGFDPEGDITPSTFTLSLDTPLRNRKASIGSILIIDNFAVTNSTNQMWMYSQRVHLTEKTSVTLGIQAGYSYFRNDYKQLGTGDDPAFNSAYSTKFIPKIGGGALLRISKSYLSLSAPQYFIYKQKDSIGMRNAVYANVIYAQAGTRIIISEDLQFRPNILWTYLSYKPAGNFDVNFMAEWRNTFSLGASYRHKNAIVGLMEIRIQQLSVGYAYDYNINQLSTISAGSHEFLLKYVFRYAINAVNPKTFR